MPEIDVGRLPTFVSELVLPLAATIFGVMQVLWAFRLVLIAWRLLSIAWNRKPQWVRDVTAERLEEPEAFAETDRQLRAAGFRSLGVLNARYLFLGPPRDEWLYTSEDGECYAEVVYDIIQPVMVQFATCFEDDSMIITRYPRGENIVTSTYISRFARSAIDHAVTYHRQQVAAWKAEGRIPCLTHHMDDVLRYDEVFRLKHRRLDYTRLRQAQYRMGSVVLAFLVLNGILIVAAINRHLIVTLVLAVVCIWLARQTLQVARNVVQQLSHPTHPVDDSMGDA